MKGAIIVILNVQSEQELPDMAEQIHDHLESLGFDIEDVHPWAREGLVPPAMFGSPLPSTNLGPTVQPPQDGIL